MRGELHALILAGGAGTRFWPLGRRKHPKPFLPLINGTTFLRHTWERILTVCSADRIRVVANKEFAEAIRQALPELPASNLLLEPVGRDTAAAIALGAVAIQMAAGDAPFLVAPIDHRIEDPAAFRAAVETACREAGDRLIAFGVPADHPHTGFGYFVTDPDGENMTLRAVRRFVEKPGLDDAEELIRAGGVFWNTGIFLWHAGPILAAIRKHLPELGGRLAGWEKWLRLDRLEELPPSYGSLASISIDHGVLERSQKVAVFPVTFGWKDIGIWATYGDTLPDAGAGNRASGKVVTIDSKENVIHHPSGVTGLIGVEGMVVVYHDGGLLICHRDRTEELKELVEILRREGDREYL